MSEPAAIERRDPVDALSQIIGTGDTQAMLEQAERNVKTVIDVARQRGFVRRYGDNTNEFYGEPAWALLGMTYGVVPFVEWTKPVQNGWEARAVVRDRDGRDVSSAEAMCTRAEQNRRNAPDHTLRAMAQTRARRNALRSALGAALVLAGVEFSDPDAPATPDQVKAVWTLAGKNGYDRDEAHERAGVDSMKDLTRESAAELIDEWSTLADDSSDTVTPVAEPEVGEEGSSSEVADGPSSSAEPTHDPDEPASAKQWDNALKLKKLTKNKILLRARTLWPEAGITQAAQITHGQLAQIIDEAMA
jgi:hypothetical protein